MEAKHWIFIGLTFLVVPVSVWFGCAYRWAERGLVAATFFSTCYLIDINLASMEMYRGDTRGFEFGVTDWMSISLLLVMCLSPRWRQRRVALSPPGSGLLYAYVMIATASAMVAMVGLYAGFGIFKLLRAMLVFIVAYNYLREEEDLQFVVSILAAIVLLEFLFVIDQRVVGIYRAFGTTPHSNTLAGYINVINMIFFALLLGGRRDRQLLYAGVLAIGSIIVLATFSRGAIVAMVLGYSLVLGLSFRDRINTRKLKVVAVLALLAMPGLIKVGPNLVDRFVNAPEESGESRSLANAAAIAMANDHLLGVGINNYSHAINETSYQQFIENPVDRGIVHNIYLLHACEMGWPGLFVFLLLVGNFLRLGVQTIRSSEVELVTATAIGIVSGMTVLWLQSSLEWFFRQTYITVQFFMLAGFLVALPRVEAFSRYRSRLVLSYRRKLWLSRSPLYQS
jgi:O-antigen ligase